MSFCSAGCGCFGSGFLRDVFVPPIPDVRFYFTFAVKGTADGQPFDIEQLVECAPFRASTGTPGRFLWMMETFPKYTGQVLDNGSGIYWKVPIACNFNLHAAKWISPGPP